MALRYKSEGEVHKDFHGLTCATLHYLLDNYGAESIKEIMKSTAQNVYRTIHESLAKGDCSELIEYWEYYMKREGGEYEIEQLRNEVRFTVNNCPALRHLVELERGSDKIVCEATRLFNEALVDGTPFGTSLERTGDFACVQTIKRK